MGESSVDRREALARSGDHLVTHAPDQPPENEEDGPGRIGNFPSWRAVYITVLIYTAGLALTLYLMSRLLDHSGG
jgi:hypothetical protein